MQGLIELVVPERRPALVRKGSTVGRVMSELLNPPFGSAAVVGWTRSAADEQP